LPLYCLSAASPGSSLERHCDVKRFAPNRYTTQDGPNYAVVDRSTSYLKIVL